MESCLEYLIPTQTTFGRLEPGREAFHPPIARNIVGRSARLHQRDDQAMTEITVNRITSDR